MIEVAVVIVTGTCTPLTHNLFIQGPAPVVGRACARQRRVFLFSLTLVTPAGDMAATRRRASHHRSVFSSQEDGDDYGDDPD